MKKEFPLNAELIRSGGRMFTEGLPFEEIQKAKELSASYTNAIWGVLRTEYSTSVRNAERKIIGRGFQSITLQTKTPSIIELGAGNGRLYKYFGNLIGVKCTLVEIDKTISRNLAKVVDKRNAKVVRRDVLRLHDRSKYDIVMVLENFFGLFIDDRELRKCVQKVQSLVSDGGAVLVGLRVMEVPFKYQVVAFRNPIGKKYEWCFFRIFTEKKAMQFLRTSFPDKRISFKIKAGYKSKIGGRMNYYLLS